jgi:hypothetical protein
MSVFKRLSVLFSVVKSGWEINLTVEFIQMPCRKCVEVYLYTTAINNGI